MVRQLPTRQRLRKALVFLAFLSFPVTMNYLSPYVVIDGAMNGVVTGSLILFGLMFVSSLFLGRTWCGWVCPGGGVQEIIEPVNRRPVDGGKIDWIKWVIWIPWVCLIVWMAWQAGGFSSMDFFHLTERGVSVDGPIKYIVYYVVVGMFVGLAMLAGRRAACHTICWMAPTMIIGRWIRNRFGWASLRLLPEKDNCVNCKKCTAGCPMSLDVNQMVHAGTMEKSECILCGSCVDVCSHGAIRYSFSASK